MSTELKFRIWNMIDKKWAEKFDGYYLVEGALLPLAGFELHQFIGISDIHGVDIFEGDIVKITGDFPFDDNYPAEYVVKQHESEDSKLPAFELYNKHNKQCIWRYAYTDLEVIGNICENPELLGETEE